MSKFIIFLKVRENEFTKKMLSSLETGVLIKNEVSLNIVQEFDRWQVIPLQINERPLSSPFGVGSINEVRSVKINL